jgi:membrane associated rhomboid family serine protease
MFILIPAWPSSGETPPITTLLVSFTVLCFLLTYPLQQSRQSVVSDNRYADQVRDLTQILLHAGSDLKPEDQALILAEEGKTPYPSAALLALFQRINGDPLYLSGESRYRWTQSYPLVLSMERAVTMHAGLTTPFEFFGFQPSHGIFPGIITHLFLHGGWLHIIFNMLFLWTAGSVLEKHLGFGLLPLYLVGGMVAAWAQMHWKLPQNQVMVGASGAIAALMGFALLAMPNEKITLFYALFTLSGRAGTFESPLWFCLPLWFLQQIFMLLMPLKGALASVGYAAHVGGFCFGAISGLGYAILHTKK